MFKRMLLVSAMLTAPPAYAGCSGGPDGPAAEICVNGACETTRMLSVCSNATSAYFTYESGTVIAMTGPEADVGEGVSYTVDGKDVPALECRAIDEGACPPVKP